LGTRSSVSIPVYISHPLHSGRSIPTKEITIAIHVCRHRLTFLIDQQRSSVTHDRFAQEPPTTATMDHRRRLLFEFIFGQQSRSSVTHDRFTQQLKTIATTDHRRRLRFNHSRFGLAFVGYSRKICARTANNSYHGSSSSVTLQFIPDLESHSSVTDRISAQ
jgi:hypothetical protein